MKPELVARPRSHAFLISLLTVWLVFVAAGLLPHRAAAAVSANLSIWHGYSFYYAQLGLNASNPAPVTFHWMENASGHLWKQFGSTNGASSSLSTNDLNALLHECTNGVWKLYLNRGDVSEELYYFTVAMTGITSNFLGNVQVTFPADGSTGVANDPTYEWTGPSHFPGLTASSRYDEPGGMGNNYFITLPGTATTWTPGPLTPGPNYLLVIYQTNDFPGIAFTTPTNILGTPLTDWTAQGDLFSYRYSFFNVAGASGSGGHILRAHYSFEDGNIFATDYSGTGNEIPTISSSNGGKRFPTNNPALGNFAAYFDNNGGSGGGWLNAPDALLNTLAGSFTVSLWVQTTQVSGNDADSGLFGNAGLVTAFTGPGGNWVVPMALTGDKLAFATGGNPQHTLHSSVAITDASEFVHLVVTRDQATGEKKIYVNGALDASGTGATDLLDTATGIDIGYNNGTGLQGVMDEIQFYAGVLSAPEVAFLYNNPGSTIPNVIGGGDPDLAEAVDAPALAWITGGDADWFLQTDETNDGNDAAQSGAIDHDQQSWIETTVAGPGWFSFYWNVSSDDSDGYDYLEFTVNGSYETEISGAWGWDYYDIYLDSGPHTLRWTYYKDSDFTAGQDAAWLDEATFEPEIEIEMTLNIEYNNDPADPGYLAYPSLQYFAPPPLTSYEIESPNGLFFSYNDGLDDNYSGYSLQGTLQAVREEIEGGPWTLFINRGHPTERQFTFTVTVNELDPTNLPPANITSPVEGATAVATNHTFVWTGPEDFTSLFLNSTLVTNVYTPSGGSTNPPPTRTSTIFPNPLLPGTNSVYLSYGNHGFTGVSISDPQTGSFESLSSWSYQVNLVSSQNRRFVVGSATAPAAPVQILTPHFVGSDFSFSLLTQAGRTHTVQSRTNLTTAPWVNITNFVGDGNPLQLQFPIGPEPESYFRVGTE